MNLKFLSAIIPVKQNTAAVLDGKQSQFNYQLLFARPGMTNEITGANTSAGGAGDVTAVIKED